MVPKDVLARLSLFEGLPEAALDHLAGLANELAFAADTTIFSPEQPSEHLYVLLEGSVRLTLYVSPVSGQVTVTVLNTPGQAFGFSSIIGSGHHHSFAEAATGVRALALEGRALMAYLDKEPAVGFVVMKRVASVISQRLAALRRHLVEVITDYERPPSATAEN